MDTPSSTTNNTLIHKLRQRIKELQCVSDISDVAANPDLPFEEVLQNITDRIPLGFQAPESTCACVTVFNEVIRTANFKTCPWKLEADLKAYEEIAGKLEVGYLGATLDEDSPFLEEEKELLQVIAARLGMVIHCKILRDSFEESEKRYRNLVENSLVGIFQTNLRGDFVYANSTCIRMFGYESLEEARSAVSLSQYWNPEERKTMLATLKQTGKLSNFEAEWMTKTGESIFILFNATLESGVITATLVDITKRKLAEQALINSERSLSEAQQLAHLGSWEWDIARGVHRWSEEVYRIFGLSPQEVEPSYEAFLASVHPDERRKVGQANQESISYPGKPYSTEYRVVRPDGTERFVQARADVLFDQNHKAVRMIGTLQDITERKRAEEELKKAFEEIKKLKEQLEAENIYLRQEIVPESNLANIVGQSDAIRYAQFRIQQVARTKMTVLLTGETGTGKGLFATALHEASDRKGKPFVHVNCAGLPPNLIESELFGREKGAFTGASHRQIGRFELADHGTIFLDEIGDLPPALQAKLLKVLESGEFERLGSPRTIKVDVRIVASTSRNLEDELETGRFRPDLFYRLDVFPITIPPLNKRIDDIPLLVKFYMEKFRKSYRKEVTTVSEQTMKTLQNYEWPGNVRELINVIERAIILSDGPVLELTEEMASQPSLTYQKELLNRATGRRSLAELERETIIRTLRETGWKIEGPAGAAASLRMNPSTLRARMKKLGIKRPKAN